MRFASRQLLSTYDIDTNVPKGTEPHNTCLSLVYCWLRIRFRSVRPCLFDYPNVYIGDKVLFRAHFCVDRRSFYYCIVRCIELESRSSLDHTHTHTRVDAHFRRQWHFLVYWPHTMPIPSIPIDSLKFVFHPFQLTYWSYMLQLILNWACFDDYFISNVC